MNCECNNNSNRVEPRIKHVYGNVLRMAIPLTLRTLVKDGDEMIVNDTDFIPSSDHLVRVVFSKGKTNYPIVATMDGNVAIIEDKGKIPEGTYDISVECYDDLGNPYRFKQNAVLYVTDTTAEAGIDEEIEYEAQTWYLNAAVFLATTEIGDIGNVIDTKLEDVFGNAVYDANAKEIRFYNKDNSRLLATIDSRPFIVDGTVADVYIDVSRQVLVVVLNEDAGGRRFSVPLYLVFNSYYKKDEVDSLVSRTVEGVRLDFSQELPLVVPVTKNGSSISSSIDYGTIDNAIHEDGRLVVACVNNANFYQLSVVNGMEVVFSRVTALDGYQELLIVDESNVWSMEDVDLGTGGGGGGYEPPVGGIPKTDLASDVQASLGKADTALQSFTETDPTVPSWAKQSSKPTYTAQEVGALPASTTIPSKTSDLTNDSGFIDKAYVDAAVQAVQTALNNLMNGQSVTDAIDTFNEIKAFLEGIDTDDPTLFNQLKSLSDAITALQTTLSQKANDNAVVKSISVNGTAQTKDGNGNVNINVQVTDGKSAYEVAVDEGFVGDEAAWLESLKGHDGNSGVASADGIESVNNLDGGTTDTQSKVYVLGANQGKALKDLIGLLEARVDDIEDGGGVSTVVSGDTLIISSASSPSVSVGSVGNNSLSCKAGNTATTSFLIQGRRLAGNIAIAVSDSTNWSVSPASISPVGGNVATTQVVISYNPAAGTAAGTQHQCTVTITCDGVTYGTISMNGTVAAAPSIILTPSTLALSTVENEPKAGTINVKGVALEGDIALAISGSGFSLSSATVAKADAESTNGVDVTVTFDGSADGSATITASSTNATNVTAAVTGTLVSRKSEGDTFNVGMLTYTVLADTSTVSVKSNGATGDITVPSSVNDENGIAYTVTALTYEAFNGRPITSIVLPSSLTTALGGSGGYSSYSHAFQNCSNLVSVDTGGLTSLNQEMFKNCSRLTNITMNSVVSIATNALQGCGFTELLLPDTVTTLYNAWLGPSNSKLRKLQIGTSSNCAISSVWFNKLNALETLIVFKATPPGWTSAYHQLQYGGGFARGFRNYQSGLTSDSASEAFDTNGTGKLYVPAGSVSSYENADPIPYGQPNPWRYMKGDANLAGDSSGRIYEITDDILLS